MCCVYGAIEWPNNNQLTESFCCLYGAIYCFDCPGHSFVHKLSLCGAFERLVNVFNTTNTQMAMAHSLIDRTLCAIKVTPFRVLLFGESRYNDRWSTTRGAATASPQMDGEMCQLRVAMRMRNMKLFVCNTYLLIIVPL